MVDELIDVLNEDGIFTGKVLPRKEVHKRGLWHRAIIVAILNEQNQILLQQRSETKKKMLDCGTSLLQVIYLQVKIPYLLLHVKLMKRLDIKLK